MKETIITTVCVGDASAVTPMAVFETAPYPIPTEPDIFEKRRKLDGKMRETVRISLKADANTVVNAFRTDTPWYLETVTVTEEEGKEPTRTKTRYDKSQFSIAGDVVEHRNGCVTIYMAKPTEEELEIAALEEENAQLLYEHLTRGA